jgi:hypothetical protein
MPVGCIFQVPKCKPLLHGLGLDRSLFFWWFDRWSLKEPTTQIRSNDLVVSGALPPPSTMAMVGPS